MSNLVDRFGNPVPAVPGYKVIVNSDGTVMRQRGTLKLPATLVATDDSASDATVITPTNTAASLAAQGIALDAYLRSNLLIRGYGLIAETTPRNNTISVASAAVSGTVYYTAIALLAGDLVTNLSISVGVAASGLTLSKVGLYSSAGALLASSADQGVSWQTTGIKTIALAAPFPVLVSGIYYVALIAVGTTPPSIARGGGGGAGTPFLIAPIGAGVWPYVAQLAQGDLPATATFAANTGALAIWMGVS